MRAAPTSAPGGSTGEEILWGDNLAGGGAPASGAGDDVLDLGKDGGLAAIGDNDAVGDVFGAGDDKIIGGGAGDDPEVASG